MPHDLRDIAELIAAASKRKAENVHVQLRNPRVRVLLQSVDRPGRGKTAAQKFENRELARARLFVALMSAGLDHRGLEEVNATLNRGALIGAGAEGQAKHPEWARTGAGNAYGTALDTLIRGAKAGEDWKLRLRYLITPQGERRVQTYVEWAEWQRPNADLTDAVDRMHGETYECELILPAADLIRGVLGD